MYLDIRTKEALALRKGEIQNLFLASFGKELAMDEWRWFYMDNPCGPAYVSLFYEGDQLLGHYAVVPTKLSVKGESMVAYRSMTTMVHPEGRGRGLFTELANRVYSMLKEDGAPLVYGFPNQNSAPGFAKYLGWNILPADRVVDFKGSDLLSDSALLEALMASADIAWDVDDEAQAAWRVSCPGTEITIAPGLVSKLYSGVHNILHLGNQGLSSIVPDRIYRVLVPNDFRPEDMDARKAFDYQFGARFFDARLDGSTFRRELIMSDVF